MPSVAPVNESGITNESVEPVLRPSDLPDTASLKAVDGGDAMSPDKSPSAPIEGETLVSPQCPGVCELSNLSNYNFFNFFFFFVCVGFLSMCMHVAVSGLTEFLRKNQVKQWRNQRRLVRRQRQRVGQRDGLRGLAPRLCGENSSLSVHRFAFYYSLLVLR